MIWPEEDWLLLSGVQHFAFCRRQWALIHIENQWAENYRTADGQLMHEHVHDQAFRESRGDCMTVRGLAIHSAELGVSGQCDAVEFHRDAAGVPLRGREGLWQPYPVEYKRGKPKEHSADELQLCAQAMCLEEMLCCTIPEGALYYGEPRRRTAVSFTPELRRQVQDSLTEMHELYKRRYTPKVRPSKTCNACSLKELCLPKLMDKETFAFRGRSRRPPLDAVNAMLSFAYSLLAHDCASALESVGLDSYVGFLHRDRPGRTSLALDLMEELRPCMADRFVLTLINNRQVKAADFQYMESGAVLLTNSGRKTFLKHWQEKKKETLTHPYLGEKLPWGMIPYIQELLLARYLRGDLDAYPPFLWK